VVGRRQDLAGGRGGSKMTRRTVAQVMPEAGESVPEVATLPEQAQHTAFLASVSSLLAGSLDYQETLEQLAQLAIQSLADWCIIDMVEEDQTPWRMAVAHRDPENGALVSSPRPAGCSPTRSTTQPRSEAWFTWPSPFSPTGVPRCSSRRMDRSGRWRRRTSIRRRSGWFG